MGASLFAACLFSRREAKPGHLPRREITGRFSRDEPRIDPLLQLMDRAALGAFLRAAREMRERGTFTFAEQAAGSQEISELLKG